jgi:hypothetical protein
MGSFKEMRSWMNDSQKRLDGASPRDSRGKFKTDL